MSYPSLHTLTNVEGTTKCYTSSVHFLLENTWFITYFLSPSTSAVTEMTEWPVLTSYSPKSGQTSGMNNTGVQGPEKTWQLNCSAEY